VIREESSQQLFFGDKRDSRIASQLFCMNIAIMLGNLFTNWEVGHELSGEIIWETQKHFSKYHYDINLAHSPKINPTQKGPLNGAQGVLSRNSSHIMVSWDIRG
jgi:hypothetical protein